MLLTMTDFQILGIPENSNLGEIKKAYRKRVKEIHPDLSDEENAFRNHLLFIEINKAYQRLALKRPSPIKEEVTFDKKPSVSNDIAVHKDPAYVFYKTAMNYFMQIHPSKWSHIAKRNTLGRETEEDINNLTEKVKTLSRLFPKAYYYFSMVVNEYPNCAWYTDSKEKMKKIEERTIMYKKIIESFKEFNKKVPRVNRGIVHK
jgi:hypothetical protein